MAVYYFKKTGLLNKLKQTTKYFDKWAGFGTRNRNENSVNDPEVTASHDREM
jgi:hypothetical protein